MKKPPEGGKLTRRGRLCYNSAASKNGEVVHFLQRRCAMVTYADMFAYSLVLIGLASLIFTVTRHKK
jgi:hypothetical protein